MEITPFPVILLERINSPIDHLEQGDSYASDLELAYAAHAANTEKIGVYQAACKRGHEADVKDWDRREIIREKARADLAGILEK